jgi:hypothetical protein
MVIKRAANGRFTVSSACARDSMCTVGHIPGQWREDAMTCPFALRAADGGGFAASALRPPTVLPMGSGCLDGRSPDSPSRLILLGARGNGWCRVGGAGENVLGVSAMGRAKCGWPRAGQRSPGSRRATAPPPDRTGRRRPRPIADGLSHGRMMVKRSVSHGSSR